MWSKCALGVLAGVLVPAAAVPAVGAGGEGRVVASRAAWRGGLIVSSVTVALDDGRVETVEVLGGHVDGVGQLVNGEAFPVAGDRVALRGLAGAPEVVPLVRATTGDPKDACRPRSAHPLAWPTTEIGFTVAYADRVTDGDARRAVRTAFATWAEAGSALRFRDDGETDDTSLGFRVDGPNHNVVVWLDKQWPGRDGEPAFTLVSFDCKSGMIVDADIMLNAKTFHFTTLGRPDAIDVQNIVTHEVGHLVGLAHSRHEEASMFGQSAPGEIKKRDLDGEDVAALREAYPR